MSMAIFESAGLERGVLALESIDVADCAGIDLGSFDTTNTPEVYMVWQPQSTPQRDIDATLGEAFDNYDDLLRRLSD